MLLKISNKSIGFDKEFTSLKDLFNNKVFPKAVMIKGITGIGKYTFCLNIVSSLTKQTERNVEESLTKDNNILLIKKDDDKHSYTVEDVKKILNFCKLKSFSDEPRFVILKNCNFLNISSVNALLKLIEEPVENIYFLFTSDLMSKNLETLESRFFIKKLFLNKKYYQQIIDNFITNNGFENFNLSLDIQDTPGIHIRKCVYKANFDLEKIKKQNEDIFYKIISDKALKHSNKNTLAILKKIKLSLTYNNDIKKIIKKYN
jgi:DNA polymerase-3 subunit delta'